jgi:2-hydroxycyclohexanecarboxyl-CoA dehydrogenase
MMAQEYKSAVVTGGASGIGRATSLRLARDGRAVAVWDLDRQGAEQTVTMIEEAGGRAIACEVDAASKPGIAAALERTHADLGPVPFWSTMRR